MYAAAQIHNACYGMYTAAASDAGGMSSDTNKTADSNQLQTEPEAREALSMSSQAPAEARSARQSAPGRATQLLPVAAASTAASDATSKSIRDYHPVDDAGWVAGHSAPYLHLAQALTVSIHAVILAHQLEAIVQRATSLATIPPTYCRTATLLTLCSLSYSVWASLYSECLQFIRLEGTECYCNRLRLIDAAKHILKCVPENDVAGHKEARPSSRKDWVLMDRC